MQSAQSNVRALLIALAVVTACWSLAGPCAADDRAQRYYDDAQARYDKEDFNGAIVQLKNVLQVEPGMLAAHALLGRAYLASGQTEAAQEALEKAIKLGVHPTELALPIAETLFGQDKFKELLDRFTADRVLVAQRPDLLVLRGHAYIQLGDLSAAKEAFDAALAAKPGFVPALRSEAELLIHQGRPRDAIKLTNDAIQRDPSDSRAWLLKGLTSQAVGDIASAMAGYTRAIELSPTNYDAHLARAWLLLDQDSGEELRAEIEYLSRKGDKDPRAAYLRATYFRSKGDRKRADAALNEIIVVLDPLDLDALKRRAPELLLIGALAHYELGKPVRARDFLDRYVKAVPRNLEARKLLASILLTLGDFVGVLQKLQELEKQTPNDPQMLALIAAAYMGRQRPGLAVQYLEQALTQSGSAPQVHATLGVGLLRAGQIGLGIEHLREAFDKDPRLTETGIALAALYIRQNNHRDAIQVAEKVVQRAPQNLAALNLLGVARVAAADRKGARAAYIQAIQADNSFTPARLNLGKLELSEGNVAAAREIFLGILKDRPKDVQAMYELAVLESTRGQRPEAVRWLEKLRAVNQRNIPGALYLVDLYARSGEAQKALEVAKAIEEVAPRDPNVLAYLGRAYLNVGDTRLAQAVFARMAGYAEFEPESQLQIARYQLLANNPQGAVASLVKALAAKPDFLAAEVLFAETDLRRGQPEAAEVRARQLQRKYPRQSAGFRLLGDIALTRDQYETAIANYRSAIDREPITDNALRLYRAYQEAHLTQQASQFIGAWLQAHPADSMAIRAIADAELKAGDLSAARSRYEAMVKVQGEDPRVLNNLANILERQKDPNALSYAQRAFALAPGDPAIQDTLGWLLVQRGRLEEGLRHLREARLRDPANQEIRYHLGSALVRAGRAKEARIELDVAVASGASFDGIEDARRLAAELPRP